MFLSYALKNRSEKATILNLDVFSCVLSFVMQNRVGQIFCMTPYCENALFTHGPSLYFVENDFAVKI